MAFGKVKWFNDAKGFGFIERREGKRFSFIIQPFNRMFQEPEEGQEVEFDVYDALKAPSSKCDVSRISV